MGRIDSKETPTWPIGINEVMMGLDACREGRCNDCPYDDRCRTASTMFSSLAEDALVMLIKQNRALQAYRRADSFLLAHGWKWEDGEIQE